MTHLAIRYDVTEAIRQGGDNPAPLPVMASRVDEALARMAMTDRRLTMLRAPVPILRQACERLVTPGVSVAEVMTWLREQEGCRDQRCRVKHSGFYRFVNRFSAVYREVQAEQLRHP